MFYEGWIPELEGPHFKHFLAEQEVCGEEWYVDFASVKERIYEEAEVYQNRDVVQKPSMLFTNKYVQDTSNGCAAIGLSHTVQYAMEIMARKGKEVVPFHVMPGWVYAVYHGLVAKDFSYGGCSIAGVMTAVNKYGVLPYDVYGKILTDKEMVMLRWNQRGIFPSIFEKYSPYAERFQIKTTVPEAFADVVACLRAGYSIEVGNNVRATLGKNGEWQTGGRWSHAFNWCFYKPGYIGMTNSWADGFAWLPISEAEKMCRSGFSCFAILDVERSRASAPKY